MSDFSLVITDLEEKNRVYPLSSGKNQIGKDSKCSTKVELTGIKPYHFELMVHKDWRLTLIPLAPGLRSRQKKGKGLIDLEPNECFDINENQLFFIDKRYSCCIQENQKSKAERVQNEKQTKEIDISKHNKHIKNLKKFKKQKFISDEEDQLKDEYKEDFLIQNQNNKTNCRKEKEKSACETIYNNDMSFSSCPEEQEGQLEKLYLENIETYQLPTESQKKRRLSSNSVKKINIVNGHLKSQKYQVKQEKKTVFDNLQEDQLVNIDIEKDSRNRSAVQDKQEIKEIIKKKKTLKRKRYSHQEVLKRQKLEVEIDGNDQDWCFEAKQLKKIKINTPDNDKQFMAKLHQKFLEKQEIDQQQNTDGSLSQSNSTPNISSSRSGSFSFNKNTTTLPSKPLKKIKRICLSNCKLTQNERNKMINLGCEFIDEITIDDGQVNYDVLVMEEFRRRTKLLLALNQSISIVSKNWILDCLDDNEVIQDIHLYFLPIPKEQSRIYNKLNLDAIQQEIFQNNGKCSSKIFENQVFFLAHSFKHVKQIDLEQVIITGGGVIVDDLQAQLSNQQKLFYLLEYEEYATLICKKDANFYADPEYVLLSALHRKLQFQFIYQQA